MTRFDKPKLLIIDDDEMVGHTLETRAQREGWQARLTCDTCRFLELVDEWRPEAVAIDLVMPGIDGIQVLQTLARRDCQARVIVTSGVGHRVLDAAGRSAREHGLHFAGVLPKPFSRNDVRRLLDRCLDVHSAESVSGPTEHFDDTQIELGMLEGALAQQQFFLEYQPKVHCSDGSLAGLEALVRWRHPSGSVISPAIFMPLFEASELTNRLTRLIIDMALEWFAGLDCPSTGHSPITLSLNISARNLEDEQLIEHIASQCGKHGVNHSRLIFELTETSAMQDPVRSLELLTRLRVHGFQLSLDDFGTGFSSMLQLVRLPFSEIKVDKSFVISAESSDESRTVVKSIVELGKSLGLRVSAEGIETQWALDFLRSIDCDYAQGYFISRPVSGEKFKEQWAV